MKSGIKGACASALICRTPKAFEFRPEVKMAVVLTDIQIAFAAGALFADAGAPVIEAAQKQSEAALAKTYSSYMLGSLIYAGNYERHL
jgi:hypothetical protein